MSQIVASPFGMFASAITRSCRDRLLVLNAALENVLQ